MNRFFGDRSMRNKILLKLALFLGFLMFCYSLAKNLAFYLTIRRATQGMAANANPPKNPDYYEQPNHTPRNVNYTNNANTNSPGATPNITPVQYPNNTSIPVYRPPELQNRMQGSSPGNNIHPYTPAGPNQQPYVIYVPVQINPQVIAHSPHQHPTSSDDSSKDNQYKEQDQTTSTIEEDRRFFD